MSGAFFCKPKLVLLEFDSRFAVMKEFVRYDFNAPISLPGQNIQVFRVQVN